jgi:5-methylcytosine-specific restriction endonuclease McrA
LPSLHTVPPPDEIPAGTPQHIAEGIRRSRLEDQQRRALERVAHEIGLPASLLKRHRQRKQTKYRLKARRRTRIAEAPEPFTRSEIIARDRSTCHICGKRCERHEIHINHDIPLSRGGLHTRSNVHVACANCNTRKGTMTTSEYLATLGTYSLEAPRTNE